MGVWPQLPEVLPEGLKGVRLRNGEFVVIHAVVLEGLRVAQLMHPIVANSAIVIDTSEL